MANFLFDAYRNSMIGKISDYTTRVDVDSDTIQALFNDDATVTPLVTHVFHSSLTTAQNPTFANAETLTMSLNPGSTVGAVDAADAVFDGSQVLTGNTSVESFVIFKNIGASAATSPLLARFDTATGLAFTPNGADVTVVFNASGVWKI